MEVKVCGVCVCVYCEYVCVSVCASSMLWFAQIFFVRVTFIQYECVKLYVHSCICLCIFLLKLWICFKLEMLSSVYVFLHIFSMRFVSLCVSVRECVNICSGTEMHFYILILYVCVV